jgi:hypothetical protein
VNGIAAGCITILQAVTKQYKLKTNQLANKIVKGKRK